LRKSCESSKLLLAILAFMGSIAVPDLNCTSGGKTPSQLQPTVSGAVGRDWCSTGFGMLSTTKFHMLEWSFTMWNNNPVI
jgi:hypothetical protein